VGVAEKSPAPLPAKLAGLLREAKWLALVALALYVLLIFATYDRADAGWSHSGTYAPVRNAGGAIGAWVADLLLYLFGVSAYWWAALCVYVVVWGIRRLEGSRLGFSVAGFAMLLVASASLERLRLHSLAVELPLAPGGVIGDAVGGARLPRSGSPAPRSPC
jgi:S-DNA-T family DNA segregation ATPase FtsK/SpoIIIE